MAYAATYRNQVGVASGLDVLAAFWILISPFVLAFTRLGNATANNVILGIVIGILALIRLFGPSRTVGVSWANVLLGVWVLISPWVLGFGGNPTATDNNILMGIIVIILAGWSSLAAGPVQTDVMDTRRGL